MNLLSRPRRPRRAGEWTGGKAVTFIVTLAATRSVTLAARRAGMSRKSAYALKARDPAFAAAWKAAIAAHAARRPALRRGTVPKRQGDNSDTSDKPPKMRAQGDTRLSRNPLGLSHLERDIFFADLANRASDSRLLARRPTAQ